MNRKDLIGTRATPPIVIYTRFRENMSKSDVLKGGNKIARILPDRIELKANTREFVIEIER